MGKVNYERLLIIGYQKYLKDNAPNKKQKWANFKKFIYNKWVNSQY